MDVYDEFFELYKDDAAAIDIYQTILNEYQQEFSGEEASPLLYTVYYALAGSAELGIIGCGKK